jgi:hypothetical protein
MAEKHLELAAAYPLLWMGLDVDALYQAAGRRRGGEICKQSVKTIKNY